MRRRLPALLFLGTLALGLAACGGGGGGQATTSGTPIADAVAKTKDAGSAKVALQATFALADKTEPGKLSGEGEFDYDARRGQLTLDLGDLLSSLGAAGVGGSADLILDEATIYLNLPLLSTFLPEGKPWIEIDPKSLGKAGGLDLGQLGQLSESDPSLFLDYLKGAGTPEEVGTEDVGGVETTHYRVTIDFDKALAQAPAEARPQLQAQLDALAKQTGSRTLPVDVWVDGDGYVRKILLEYPSKDASQPPSTFAVELSDFGVDVNVEPPPADQVTDISELGAIGVGGGSGSTSGTTTTG